MLFKRIANNYDIFLPIERMKKHPIASNYYF